MTLLANVALADAAVVNEDPQKICHNLENYSENDLVGGRNESQKVVDKLVNNQKSDSNVQDTENKTIEEERDTFLTGTKGGHDENPEIADGEHKEGPEFSDWKQDETPQFHDEEQNENLGLPDSKHNKNPELIGGNQDKNPKLPDGFYLVENIRKKRIRQGQVQYLVKWIDWPESSNTWEPIENLSECPLLISAFEERLKRKRRRKTGSSRRPRKRQDTKQQPPSSMASSEQNTVTPSEAPPSPPHELNVSNGGGDDHHTGTAKETADEQDSQTPLEDSNGGDDADADEEEEDDEAEMAKETVGENAEKFQANETEGNVITSNERVKKSSQKYGNGWIPPDDEEEAMEEASETIVEIIKAIGYSSPFTVGGDVSITFVARRSDGMEVTVDNGTLKKTHPQLLIRFYEKHLQTGYLPRL